MCICVCLTCLNTKLLHYRTLFWDCVFFHFSVVCTPFNALEHFRCPSQAGDGDLCLQHLHLGGVEVNIQEV